VLSAPPAQSAERSATILVTGGKTLLQLDGGAAAVLADAGVSIRAPGPATGPSSSTVFAFPVVGGEVNKKQLGGRIVHSGGLVVTGSGPTLEAVMNFGSGTVASGHGYSKSVPE